MSLNRNRQVRPLTEELKEIGLDPQKTLGEIHRTTALIDRRMGGGNGGGAPAYASGRQLQEVREQPGASQGQQSGSGEDLEEAMRAVKKKRVTMGEKLKAKRSRRKRRSSLRKAAKMYYKKLLIGIQMFQGIQRDSLSSIYFIIYFFYMEIFKFL